MNADLCLARAVYITTMIDENSPTDNPPKICRYTCLSRFSACPWYVHTCMADYMREIFMWLELRDAWCFSLSGIGGVKWKGGGGGYIWHTVVVMQINSATCHHLVCSGLGWFCRLLILYIVAVYMATVAISSSLLWRILFIMMTQFCK